MKIEKSELQLESVVSRISLREIDLQPDFQRGEVWDRRRRQRLIDTVLRGWYVPAIHIVVEEDGAEVVLDGQQRLAAIRDFFQDELRIDGTIEPPDPRIDALHNKRFSELPEEVRRAVNRFVLQIITLTDYEPQEPNELFFRLNQSYNLTPPEKRNALHGKARDQVKSLVLDLIADGLLERQMIGFGNARLAYDDIVARSCVAIELGSMRRHINNKTVEEFYRAGSFSDAVLDGVRSAGGVLLSQLESAPDRIKLNKGTLQTWLVYCYWASVVDGSIPPYLVGSFERDRQDLRREGQLERTDVPAFIGEVVRIYDDRASYRVTDVSSVVARDLAIRLYAQTAYGSAPLKGSDRLLRTLAAAEPSEAQRLFFDFADTAEWGDPIPGHEALQG